MITDGMYSFDFRDTDASDLQEHRTTGIPASSNISLPILNYMYRGDECEDMSVYEMSSWTDVIRVTDETTMRYRDRHASTSRNQTKWTQKVAFRAIHPNTHSHWISFYKEAHTPVIIGTIDKTSQIH
jgi:hypothetical protein